MSPSQWTVFQEPFSVHEFVERLAWKTMGARARGKPEDFDPMLLHGAFEKMIADLQDKNAKVQKDIDSWEAAAREEEKRHWARVGELQKTNQVETLLGLINVQLLSVSDLLIHTCSFDKYITICLVLKC